MSKYDEAVNAIEEFFGDTTVPREKTLQRIEELQTKLEIMAESLRSGDEEELSG